MKIAVLSLVWNRLPYTQHCFARLQELAGCRYDHYVLDNGSTDGTTKWLDAQAELDVTFSPENLGIYPALNILLDLTADYDVRLNFDNDCELTVDGTLRVVARIARDHPGSVIGPLVHGLNNPPSIMGRTLVDGFDVGTTEVIGGILMPLPRDWRYPEGGPFVHYDNVICHMARADGETIGQLLDYPVNHYRTTFGQWQDYPEYFSQKAAEGIPI